MSVHHTLKDIQSAKDDRQLSINRVGVRRVKHPIWVHLQGEKQASIGEFSLYVDLPADQKGTHMSRFLQILHAARLEVSADAFKTLVKRIGQELHATEAEITVDFTVFLEKEAPISKEKGLIDYAVSVKATLSNNEVSISLTVQVPVTSLCPCSKDISDYGAHNQRSHIIIDAVLTGPIWIEEVIRLAEAQASCEVYAILKRPDEKYVTEFAYDHPKFVEDMVRDVAASLLKEDRLGSFSISSENFESIHNHSAYALITRQK